ncbi:hypothetical protein RvY_02200 [Ramazzottius varieornatus]|uniref:Uncharacterized protein n=1 Tax=Ramazzottius varieornatus TaxID=947166 RepID=A0A1D1UJQ5_RAMVA|nr:hypothetical protein RvY_02200 [Ramazzottius varieornatus]
MWDTPIVERLRLGAKLCEPHACRCEVKVDGLGRHGLACKNSAGRHSRHDALNDIIHQPNGLLRDAGRRPDGLTFVPWYQGKALAWDVTVVDTLAQTYLQGSTERVGFAANQVKEKKRSKYVELEGRYLFCAVGFETFGVFGNEARDLIQKIMDRTVQEEVSKRGLGGVAATRKLLRHLNNNNTYIPE